MTLIVDLDVRKASGACRIDLGRYPVLCRFVSEIVIDKGEWDLVLGEKGLGLSAPGTGRERLHANWFHNDLLSM